MATGAKGLGIMKASARRALGCRAACAVALLWVVAGCGHGGTQARLSEGVRAVVQSGAYAKASWGVLVVDAHSGEVLESLNPDAMLDPASTTKLFSSATAFDALGKDHRIETPVYRTGELGADGVLAGDLVLVASGDLVLGGRGALSGTLEYTDADHSHANALGAATLSRGDPLAGLQALARQVAAAGITEVGGEVWIDDRLYGPEPSFDPRQDYVLTPIMVNENLLDLVVTPAASAGGAASVESRPESAAYRVERQVVTVAAGQPVELAIEERSGGVITVRGQLPVDAGPLVRTLAVKDPASFARTLFIEALQAAGVKVNAAASAKNDATALAPAGSYDEAKRVAALLSPPLSEYAKLVMKVSHNLGADTLLMLAAVREGGRRMEDGLRVERRLLERAGVDARSMVVNDGQGAYGANYISPRAVVQLLRYMRTRPDFAPYFACLPVLGVSGSLAHVLTGSPAAGKARAKTGTHVGPDALNQRLVVQARALGGYLTTSSGRELVYDINVNQVGIQDLDGLKQLIHHHATILEALHATY